LLAALSGDSLILQHDSRESTYSIDTGLSALCTSRAAHGCRLPTAPLPADPPIAPSWARRAG
jgi:hypothetical protein